MKTNFTKQEIFDIIYAATKDAMKRKNEYIKKNGFKHVDTIRAFDAEIATLGTLYSKFEIVGDSE